MSNDTKRAIVSPVTYELSRYMAEAASRPLPPDVSERAILHTLDTLASMISGGELPAGERGFAYLDAVPGTPLCSVAGYATKVGPLEAALTNGMLAHADETDDSHAPSLSHPGCAVVPAALAIGEWKGASGAALLRAVALGYDVGSRVTMTLGIRRFFAQEHKSTHSVAGLFGATAAAASLAGFDDRKMRWALDYAAQQSSGIAAWQRDPDHIVKAFVFGGMPARNGAAAALMVDAGFTAVEDPFAGADNYFLAYGPDCDPAGLVDGLGTHFAIAHSNIKKWTVGSPIQAPLDAAEDLLRDHAFTAADVTRLVVEIGDREAKVVDNRGMPGVCVQHMLAIMLIDRTATFASIHDEERMKDPEVLALRSKVELIASEELGRALPRREAKLTIELADGRRLFKHITAVRGTSDNPMPRAEVVAKAQDLIAPLFGDEKTRRLVDMVLKLPELSAISELGALLRR
ncbi:MmgE/PrpD family protein [Ancylobacter sp. A5.8]|uniref:MmgE/PrpD family protein n=1 Tax=Ancylobacter gelatini TaxID=2919920 RepID=UPI001F4EC263|nr:MmgE/PrpD family protein [Ancylobacter gelatini]MCJ8144000.1 MmgE/PrpD family protein [Ancylobacter gelatini]